MTLRQRHAISKCAVVLLIAVTLFGLMQSASVQAADESLARIRQSGTISVGTEAAYAPYEFMKDGQIVGYDKDILDYVMSGLNGVKLVQTDVPFQGLLPGLLASKFDLICSAMTMYPDSVKKFAFTMPISESTLTIVTRKGDNRIKGANDLSGKTVGVQLATGSDRAVRALDAKLTGDRKAGLDIKGFTSSPEAFLALSTGQLDAAIGQSTQIKTLMLAQPNIYQVSGSVTGERLYIGWALRPDERALRDYINTKIKELNESGRLAKLQEKWFGFKMELPTKKYLPEGAL
jgi:polar amino acid transport system substrate-binding protein